MGWGIAAAIVGTSLFGYTQERSAARDARRIDYRNADRLLELDEQSRALLTELADRNAGAVTRVGFANARAVEEAARNNAFLGLLALQVEDLGFKEEVRQHVLSEKIVGGQIRAIAGSSGISVNEGSPLHAYNSFINESQYQLKFKRSVHALEQGAGLLSIATETQQEYKRADLIRMTATEDAETIRYNAFIDSEISHNEAVARAEAIRSGADLDYRTRSNRATTGLLTGGIQAYGAYRTDKLLTQGNA